LQEYQPLYRRNKAIAKEIPTKDEQHWIIYYGLFQILTWNLLTWFSQYSIKENYEATNLILIPGAALSDLNSP
jgi:hypothetical protein